jgi:oligogalacturonide lyase
MLPVTGTWIKIEPWRLMRFAGRPVVNDSAQRSLEPGFLLPDEPRRFVDEETGAPQLQLTGHPSINHSFFFLNPSFRPGHPGQVGFVTHRGGGPQPCLFDEEKGQSTCIGVPDEMQPFSPSFSLDGSRLFYTNRGGEVRQIDIESHDDDPLAQLDGASLGEAGPSADGRFLITACKRGDHHGLFLVDIEKREGRIILERKEKIIHPQFQPGNPELIEYAGDPRPRLFTIRRDGSEDQCLYQNGEREFIVHESFLGASDDLIFAVWPYKLGRMNVHRKEMETVVETNAWHMASSRDGRKIVSDTNHPDRGLILIDPGTGDTCTLCGPGSSNGGTQWKEDHPAGPEVWAAIRGETGQDLSWMEMKVDSVYGPQWSHPHPAFDETGTRVVYTSDRTGHPQVYVVEVTD